MRSRQLNRGRGASRLLMPLAVALVLAQGGAFAQTDDATYLERRGIADRWNIRLGGYIKDFDTVASLTGEPEIPTPSVAAEIPVEDVLGLDSESRDFRLDGHYRFNRKHRLLFGYNSWGRGAVATLEQDVEWDDLIYEAGAEVRSNFDQSVLKLAWKYSIVNNGRWDAGFSAGFTVFEFDIGLEGEARIIGSEDEAETSFEVRAVDLIAPVPMLGLHGEWTAMRRLFVSGSFEWFKISYGAIDAQVSDIRFAVDYYVSRNFGLGLGYNRIRTDVAETDPPVLQLDYLIKGVQFYLNFSFG